MIFKTATHSRGAVNEQPKLIDHSLQTGASRHAMTLRGTKLLVGMFAVSLLLGGCASRINQFKSFSDAGTLYADTMGKLVNESGDISIDADSAVLIEARSEMSTGYDGDRDTKLGKHNELIKERLVILGDINEHGQLLKSYFEALAALAGSDVGTEISTATKGIVGELGKINPKISNAKLGSSPISSLIGPVTNMVVAGFQQTALEKELKTNAQVIERELALQVAAIKAIAEIWKTDQQIIVGGKDINNRDQFLQNNALPGNWAANRKAILITDNSTKLVDSATDASEGLKETFEKLVANKASIEDIPLIVTDLIKVLALIELVKKGSSA
jgi:hypothetical protein